MQYHKSIGFFLCATSLLLAGFAVADDYDEPATLVSYRAALHGSPLDRQANVGKDNVLRMSLEDCIKYALRNNRKILSGDYAITAAEAQENEAHALGKPIFDYELGSAPVPNDASRAIQTFFQGQWAWTNRVKLGMAIPITTFGKLATAAELAGRGIDAARERRVSDEVMMVSRMRQLYYGIQMAEEIASLVLQAINRLSDEIKKAESQDLGSDVKASERYSPIDKLRMKVFRADLEKRLAEARMREDVAINALKIQMGLPMKSNVRPMLGLSPVDSRLSDYEEYLARMNHARPESRLADIGVEAKRLENQMIKKQWYPDLGVGAYFDVGRTIGNIKNVQTTDDYVNPFNFSRAGIFLRLQGRLDVHSLFAKMDRTENEFYKASLERDMAKDGLALEVKEAFLRVKQSAEQVKRADETKKLARQMVFLSKSNLDLGIGEKSEYVDALQTTLLSRSQYLEAVFNYNAAVSQLDEKIGYVPYNPKTVDLAADRNPLTLKETAHELKAK